MATGHGVSHGLGVIEGGASISGLKPADQMGLREGTIMTIGNRKEESTKGRTRGISPINFWSSFGKCIRGYYCIGPAVHFTPSNFGETKKVFEIGNVRLYSLPKENDHG